MIAMSREPSAEHKVQFPSIAELKDGFATLTNRIARKVRFRGRKLRAGPLANAILLHYMLLPEAEQLKIAEAGLRRYETLLTFSEPVDDFGSVLGDGGDAGEKGGGGSGGGVVGLGGTVRKIKPKAKRKD